jgi:hypothetical protein
MQATKSLPETIIGRTGIPLPHLTKTAESLKILESRSDLLPTPPMMPMSASKVFVPFKLRVRRFFTFILRARGRKQNFI